MECHEGMYPGADPYDVCPTGTLLHHAKYTPQTFDPSIAIGDFAMVLPLNAATF